MADSRKSDHLLQKTVDKGGGDPRPEWRREGLAKMLLRPGCACTLPKVKGKDRRTVDCSTLLSSTGPRTLGTGEVLTKKLSFEKRSRRGESALGTEVAKDSSERQTAYSDYVAGF